MSDVRYQTYGLPVTAHAPAGDSNGKVAGIRLRSTIVTLRAPAGDSNHSDVGIVRLRIPVTARTPTGDSNVPRSDVIGL